MTNFKQKQITTSAGKEYTLQFPGARQVTRITDRVKNKHGIPSDEKLADEMLAHVVVDPKCRMEDFDGPEGYKELVEIIQEAFSFITGNDEPNEAGEDDRPE